MEGSYIDNWLKKNLKFENKILKAHIVVYENDIYVHKKHYHLMLLAKF